MILLVDDNDLFAEMMRGIVDDLGFVLLVAECGEDALLVLQEHPDIQLVFMDYGLPGGISGIHAAALIRALPPPACDVPIVGLTGGHFQDDHELRIVARLDLEVRKPILPADIEALIKAYARP